MSDHDFDRLARIFPGATADEAFGMAEEAERLLGQARSTADRVNHLRHRDLFLAWAAHLEAA